MELPKTGETTMNTYFIHHAALTVIRTDANGEEHDLNAGGAPCENLNDLRAFVVELFGQGYFGANVRDQLLAEIG